MSSSDVRPTLGQRFGDHYLLERVLGEGGIGVVYAGVDVRTSRRVAVKLLRAEHAARPSAIERFVREARHASELRHPNIVEFIEAGETADGAAFLVFELLVGGTLEDRRAAAGTLTVDETVGILIPIVHAVAFAHEVGIVHRDIKPANIFLADTGAGYAVPKLGDLGLSKSLLSAGPTVTKTGAVIGSPGYMAPEQIHRGAPIGPQADVWALGLVLLECITGRRPWNLPERPPLPYLLATVASQQALPALTVDPSLPPPLARVLDRCLVLDPAGRFADGRALADALQSMA